MVVIPLTEDDTARTLAHDNEKPHSMMFRKEFRFELPLAYESFLRSGIIDEKLRNIFEDNAILLSANAKIIPKSDKAWSIFDGNYWYVLSNTGKDIRVDHNLRNLPRVEELVGLDEKELIYWQQIFEVVEIEERKDFYEKLQYAESNRSDAERSRRGYYSKLESKLESEESNNSTGLPRSSFYKTLFNVFLSATLVSISVMVASLTTSQMVLLQSSVISFSIAMIMTCISGYKVRQEEKIILGVYFKKNKVSQTELINSFEEFIKKKRQEKLTK